MFDLPLAPDLVAILRAEHEPLTVAELTFYDFQLREAMRDEETTPTLEADAGFFRIDSWPGVALGAVLLVALAWMLW